MHEQTPSQTIGPFFGFALPWQRDSELTPQHDPAAIHLWGTVLDGAGEPVPDALIEIWQSDADGTIPTARGSLSRDGVTFTGFGRTSTDRDGAYRFDTRKPGAVGDGAPYALLTVFARGLTHHLFTRAYFDEDAALHEGDRLLQSVPADRRPTLIARAERPGVYRFDIRLQAGADGAAETVFLEFND